MCESGGKSDALVMISVHGVVFSLFLMRQALMKGIQWGETANIRTRRL